MASRNTDIVDPHLRFVATTEFELVLIRRHCQQMNVSRSILVKRHRLEKNVVRPMGFLNLFGKINDLVDCWPDLESVRVHLLTNLAFETFPVERPYVLVGGRKRFFLLLRENPRFQTGEMNQTDRSLALASDDKRISLVVLIAPANSALDVFLWLILDIDRALYF